MPYCQKCGHMLYQNGTCPNCTPGVQQTYMPPQYPPVMNQEPVGFTPAAPKRKKTGLIVTVVCIVIALLLAGGAALYHFVLRDLFEKKETKPEPAKKTVTRKEEEEIVVDREELSFEIDGVTYELPCALEEFLDNGWDFSDENEDDWAIGDLAAAGENGTLLMERDSLALFYLVNDTDDVQNVEDCTVVAVSYLIEGNILFAGGVELDDIGSTDDIIDIFGEPDYYSNVGCVYEGRHGILEVCYDESLDYPGLSVYTEEAIDLGYRPEEEGAVGTEDGGSLENSGTDANDMIEIGEKPYEGETLVVWTNYEPYTATCEVADAWIERFEELSGADVQVVHQGRDLQTLLYPALDAGERIDVFLVGSTIQLNLQKDHALDVTAYIENSDMEDRAYPILMTSIRDVSEDGATYYGIPSVASVNQWWYNKDIFEDVGIIEVPTTIEEFEIVCDDIVAAGYYPIAQDSAYASSVFGMLVGRLVGEDVVAQMTHNGGFASNERFVAACQKIIDWRNKGYFEPDAPNTWPNSQNRMGLMQDTAMIYTGMWLPGEVEAACAERLNWGSFSMPVDPTCEDAKPGVSTSCSVNMINENCDNTDLAWDYIYFMNTGAADKANTDADDYLTNDMTNEPLSRFEGAQQILMNETGNVNYAGGMHDNADIKTSVNEVIVNLMSGKYATGLEAAQAFDALLN